MGKRETAKNSSGSVQRQLANDTKPATDAADIEHSAGDVPAVTAHYHSMP
jgi:hypothetical protein